MISELTQFSFVRISTVVGIDVTIVGELRSDATQAVVLITKCPASFSHSMLSQSFVIVVGDSVSKEETVVETVVTVTGVNMPSGFKSSFSVLMGTEPETVSVIPDAAVAVVSSPEFMALLVLLTV